MSVLSLSVSMDPSQLNKDSDLLGEWMKVPSFTLYEKFTVILIIHQFSGRQRLN